MKLRNLAIVPLAALLFTGCGSSSSSSNTSIADFEVDKLFFFYDQENKGLYTYETDHEEATDANSDENNNIDMLEQEEARLIYWPHATTDENGTVSMEKKFVFVKENYSLETDGNLTYENLIHIGHFHDEDLYVHAADEFDPNNSDYSDDIKAKKAAAMKALNMHLIEQNEIKDEMSEALTNEGKTLCTFFVPYHEEHENEDEHESIHHYASTQDGQIYIFNEGENGLEKVQGNVTLTGVDSCEEGQIHFTAGSTTTDEEGVYVYNSTSQTLFRVDRHDGSDYHEHSKWELNDLLPSGVTASQMIGFNVASESDDEDDHDHD